LGHNITEKAVTRIANAERAVLANIDSSLQRVDSSAKHGLSSNEKDVQELLKRTIQSNVFTGRHYIHFCNFRRNRLEDLIMSDMFQWINKHKRNISLGVRDTKT